MKISCQSCPAKYTIADEKVLGKIVKIRCKKCGATIVINGNDPEATTVGSSMGADAGGGGEQWTVNVADGDQRTMTVDEIAQEYRSGVVNEETFCWKDGMNDWLPLREIDELYSACAGGGQAATDYAGDFAPVSMRSNYEQEMPTAAGTPDFGGGGALFGGDAHADANGNGSSAPLFGAAEPAPAAAPSAARRTGGRNPGADLFGGVAQAGGEEDVMTSAAAGMAGGGAMAAPSAVDSKLTGQRNENSVLFSLNALTSNTGAAPKEENKTTATGDGSGLIDIRALSANMAPDTGPKSTKHVDDIMNLGGGGAFSAALAAPVLAPPTGDMGASPYDSGGGGKSKNTLLYAIIGGCAFLALAAIVVAYIVVNGNKPTETGTGSVASSAPTGTETASAAPTETATGPVASAAPTETANPSGAKPIQPGVATGGGGGGGGGSHASSHTGGGGGGGGGSTAAATPAETAAPAKPQTLFGAMSESVGEKPQKSAPATPTGGSAPFDRGAAAASLGGVNVQSCKKAGGPTGSGHVRVTFQPSGTVSTVDVDQPPFAGSSVGGCVAGKFRGAHVPPFAGSAVTVGKSFIIN